MVGRVRRRALHMEVQHIKNVCRSSRGQATVTLPQVALAHICVVSAKSEFSLPLFSCSNPGSRCSTYILYVLYFRTSKLPTAGLTMLIGLIGEEEMRDISELFRRFLKEHLKN